MAKGRPQKNGNGKEEAKNNNNGANLGFEAKLWAAADKLRGNMESSDYKHVALGLIFLKYISDAFEAKREALLAEELADPEDPEEYLAENVFWVPKQARWSHLQANAKQPTIGKLIDDAMLAIESNNASLKGVLPKDYARPALNKVMLGELIDLVSGIGMGEEADRSKDILGRVYEYFLVDGVIRDPDDPFPGPSAHGWRLDGSAWPDPPGTHRSTPPHTSLHVHEPDYPGRTDLLLQEYATALTGQVLDPARVIPDAAGVDGGQALQFPFLQFFAEMKDPDPAAEIAEVAGKFLDGAGDRARIVVESGDVLEARCLLSTNRQAKVAEFMLLRGLDAEGGVVEEIKLPGRFIGDPGQLPAAWLDASGPWQADVRRVVDFFTDEFKESHLMFLVEYEPAAPIARFEMLYRAPDPDAPFRDPPAVVLGVVETLSRAEAQRAETAQQWSEEMVEVVVNSLQEGDRRPLFAPDTLYTVTVEYHAEIRKSDKPSVKNAGDFTQQFRFRTAAAAPPRLNPWVLASVPENDAVSHFVDDPVQFLFNDSAGIQLFSAFGKTLRAVLRKANGNHPPQRPAIGLPNLQGVKGTLGSPYAVSMNEVISDLPCIPGTFELEQHQVFTLDILLERGTEYILDIEAEPGDPSATTPLFRTAFTTSRFTGAGELAGLVRESLIGERLLRDALVLPARARELVVPDDTAPRFMHTVQVQTVTDAEMEAALLAATGSDVPPAYQPGVTLLWSGLAPSRPVAVLVDAPEPLLRTRPVPVEVGTPTPDGDLIQHYRTGEQLYLELAESGSALAERVVYATGGSRALVFLQAGATGTLRLALRQHRLTLLLDDPVQREFALVELAVPERAVWE